MKTGKKITLAAVTAVTVGGFALGVPALAGAVTSALPAAASTPGYGYAQGGPGSGQGGPASGEKALTGETADSVRAAAEKAVPGGTILRVETDNDGIYEAHVHKADGTEVVVKVDKSFTVTSIDTFGGRGGHGPGRNGETRLTGDTAAKVKAAAEGAVSGGTVLRVETDHDGTYEAHVRKTDGTQVVVKVDKTFTVTSVDTFAGRGPDGHGPDGHDGWGGPGAGSMGQGAPNAQGSTGASGGGQPSTGSGTQSSSFFVDA